MCRTNPFNFGPCDALVNIQTIIMSIFIIPLRLRLIHSFIMVCTYVPFLIRWDLIPPYITDKSSPGPGKQEQDSPPEVIDTGLNCKKEEPKKEAPSPFEQELDKDTLNQIKTEPLNFHVEDDEEERGVPVFTAFEINDRIRVIDFKKDYDLGKIISNSNSATDVISTLNTPNSNEMIYHIYNYKDACSISKRGDFPYHVRSILINNWEPNKIKRK